MNKSRYELILDKLYNKIGMQSRKRGSTLRNQILLWEPGRLQNCSGARWRVPMVSFKLSLLIALPSL
jgi:hypothetical protein